MSPGGLLRPLRAARVFLALAASDALRWSGAFWALLCRPVRLPRPAWPRPARFHAGARRRGPAAQLAQAARLARRELSDALTALSDGTGRLGEALVPALVRFPAALLSYLLVVFALEAFIIQTLSTQPATAPMHLATARPPSVEEALTLASIEATLPSAFATAPDADVIMGNPSRFIPRFDAEPVLDELPDLAQYLPNRLLAMRLPAPERPEAYDSVRMAVVRSSVRMPVDPQAVHPLDRAGFLATATQTTRFKRLFAGQNAHDAAPRLFAQRPETAIAPPVTRLDRLRMIQRQHRRLGSLCALFESGVRGIFAIGFDPKGGTSYGKYQISSRKGAMDSFLKYLDRRAPSWAMRLRSSGTVDTGGTGGPMPREWKKIASEHPRLFERLQDDFIHTRYYSPSLNELRMRAGLDLDDHPEVVREVLWSTAVQHGPSGGANIFIKASRRAKLAKGKSYAAALLEEVFRERASRLARFPGRQRSALQARLRQERTMALGRLRTAATKTSVLAEATGRLL